MVDNIEDLIGQSEGCTGYLIVKRTLHGAPTPYLGISSDDAIVLPQSSMPPTTFRRMRELLDCGEGLTKLNEEGIWLPYEFLESRVKSIELARRMRDYGMSPILLRISVVSSGDDIAGPTCRGDEFLGYDAGDGLGDSYLSDLVSESDWPDRDVEWVLQATGVEVLSAFSLAWWQTQLNGYRLFREFDNCLRFLAFIAKLREERPEWIETDSSYRAFRVCRVNVDDGLGKGDILSDAGV